jgi:hypothetical protein
MVGEIHSPGSGAELTWEGGEVVHLDDGLLLIDHGEGDSLFTYGRAPASHVNRYADLLAGYRLLHL